MTTTQLRDRLRRLVAARAISAFGEGLALVAFPLVALRLTHNALMISGIAAAASLPWLVLGLPAGALVDRVDRRQLVLAVELARGVVVALVALGAATSSLSIAELYVAAFLVGAGETVVSATTRATVPLVAGDELVRTNGRITAAETVGVQLAGPAAGGAVFAVARSLPFGADALSCVVSGILLCTSVVARPRGVTRGRQSVKRDISAGLEWFYRSPRLRILTAAIGSFALCQSVVLAVLVLYASRVLHLGSVGYGVILAVAAVGDVLGSLLAERVHRRVGPVATILIGGALAGGAYVLLGSTADLIVAVGALALEAGGSSLGNVATWSLRQRAIPTERFGVVNNVVRMCVSGVALFGALLGGVLATSFGTRATCVVAGALQLGLLAMMALPLRSIAD